MSVRIFFLMFVLLYSHFLTHISEKEQLIRLKSSLCNFSMLCFREKFTDITKIKSLSYYIDWH